MKCSRGRGGEHICDRDIWDAHVVRMEELAPGFWRANGPLRAMGLLRRPGYRFGYEIGGYGTVVGYCSHHEPHPDKAGAMECGRRFLNNEPERLRDAWRRPKRRRYR